MQLPSKIGIAFFGGTQLSTELLGGGDVNANYKVTPQGGQPVVVQRLNPIFSEQTIQDYVIVSALLLKKDWEVPCLVRTISGQPFYKDESGSLWRAFDFIANDPNPTLNASYMQHVGTLLAKLHQTLSELDYTPTFALEHFHETPFYAQKLEKLLKSGELQPEPQTLAERVLETYQQLPPLPERALQLIHGDPRIANILSREGKPFTFIDFDTLMLGTIWLDLGDLLRSTMESNLEKPEATQLVQAVVDGYYAAVAMGEEPQAFALQCSNAAKRIALELAMRFLIDTAEDSYFAWDSTKFASRPSYTLFRAQEQWRVYERL